MSNHHTEQVRRARLDDIPTRQQGTCKHVLGWIAYHASEEEADIAYPGIETLELETGLRAKAIVTATETLAAHEWISKKRRLGTSNIYRLNMRKIREHKVPKEPSKVAKLIDELPGLGFSHEPEPGSDANPDPTEAEPDPSENSYPQADDQQTCPQNTSDMSSEHGGNVLTTPPGCSHDTQTIREPSAEHQPTNHDRDGWLDVDQQSDGKDGGETEPSAGYVLLADLGVKGAPRNQWAKIVTDALHVLGPNTVGTQLAGGASHPGPGAIVKTRLPGLKEQLAQAREKPTGTSAGSAAAWPDWCGSCLREERRYENVNGALVKCPFCHPYASRSTASEDAVLLDQLAQMTGDAA